MTVFRQVVGYTALLAPYLLIAYTARDWYVGVGIAAYGVFAVLLTLE